MKTLTQEQLKELLTYDLKTGEFFWKVDKSGHAKNGQKCSLLPNNQGYLRIGINRKRYLAHRLAWLYVYGNFPENDIDHINRNRSDNRIENLRLATRSENLQNRISKGVYWNKRAKKWQAQIVVNKVHHYLGVYEDFDKAHEVYVDTAKKLHSHHPHVAS